MLVVDDADRPRGWMDVTGLEGVRAGRSLDDSTAAGGSLFPEGGDLRQALDAAISSPSGIGVAVRRDGSVLGGIDATEVLAVLAAQRGTEASERSRAFTESGPAAG